VSSEKRFKNALTIKNENAFIFRKKTKAQIPPRQIALDFHHNSCVFFWGKIEV
jgi:hypothetical protein